MCLSTVYYVDDTEQDNPIASNVTEIHSEDGHLFFAELFGDDVEVDGSIEHVDLIKNYILVRKPVAAV